LQKYDLALADAEKASELYRQQGNKAGYQQAQKLILFSIFMIRQFF
jgi:hypothetical protein